MKLSITTKPTYPSMVIAAYLTIQFSGLVIGAFLLLFALGNIEDGDPLPGWFLFYFLMGLFTTAIPTLIYSLVLPKMIKMVLRITKNSFMTTNCIITSIAVLIYMCFAIPQGITPMRDPELFWSLLCAVVPASLFGTYAAIKAQARPVRI